MQAEFFSAWCTTERAFGVHTHMPLIQIIFCMILKWRVSRMTFVKYFYTVLLHACRVCKRNGWKFFSKHSSDQHNHRLTTSSTNMLSHFICWYLSLPFFLFLIQNAFTFFTVDKSVRSLPEVCTFNNVWITSKNREFWWQKKERELISRAQRTGGERFHCWVLIT